MLVSTVSYSTDTPGEILDTDEKQSMIQAQD